jgi:predicted peptidase
MQALWIGLLAWEIAAMPPPADEIVDRFEAQDFTLGSGDEKVVFHYRLLKPTKIEPGKLYPLVLFLHGAGERGDDNKMQLLYFPELMASDANREKYPCYLLAPQCREGKKWVDVDWSAPKSSPQSDLGEEARAVLGMLDETERKYPVDRNRVYLTGLSMGGYGSWALAIQDPQRWAAVVPICGGADETQASKLVGVPIWAFHGSDDKAVPVERSQKMIAAIRAAGGSPKYSELPGVGHNSWTPAYTDPEGVIPWMFGQVNRRR